jgi:hypothetical protein
VRDVTDRRLGALILPRSNHFVTGRDRLTTIDAFMVSTLPN